MSIAVRVSVWVLGVLVLVSAAVAVVAIMQQQKLQNSNQSLHSQIADDQARLSDLKMQAQKLEDKAQSLNTSLTQTQQDKEKLQGQFDELKHKSDDLQNQMEQANTEREDLKNRVETISRERDDLLQKLKNQPTKIVYKTRIVKVKAPSAAAGEGGAGENAAPADASALAMAAVPNQQGDEYWAGVLKQKAELQVELTKEKSDLDQAALQVADLKKQNSDLELEVKKISNEKDEIIQKIKYGQDLADSLSIDVARARAQQNQVNQRAEKLKGQNLELLNQIRDLSSAKVALERTVSRLTDEKDAIQKKLIETESVIQSRIDDIWKIKEGLDRKLTENAPASSTPGSMELPPIIVNASNGQQAQQAQQAQQTQQEQQGQMQGASMSQPASSYPQQAMGGRENLNQGSIISINESNNFVIVDLGQDNSPVSVGVPMKVFRHSDQIATLEVIQVRRDICAADIKDKSAVLRVGDIVRI